MMKVILVLLAILIGAPSCAAEPTRPGVLVGADEYVVKSHADEGQGQTVSIAKFPVQKLFGVCSTSMRTVLVQDAGPTTLAEGTVVFETTYPASKCSTKQTGPFFDADEDAIPFLVRAISWVSNYGASTPSDDSCKASFPDGIDFRKLRLFSATKPFRNLELAYHSTGPGAQRVVVEIETESMSTKVRAFAACTPLEP